MVGIEAQFLAFYVQNEWSLRGLQELAFSQGCWSASLYTQALLLEPGGIGF